MRDETAERPLRVAFRTLGCRLNQVDTEGMKTALGASLPAEIVGWDEEADVYVLNSCTVTGKADQECRRLARQVKRRHPRCKVIVAGCYAQTQPEDLAALPEIDGVVGNTAKDSIARWLPELLAGEGSVIRVDAFDRDLDFSAPVIDDFDGRSRAFVKVQDGCDLRCAYCLIWKARGPARSRPVDGVLEQLRVLAGRGFREVVLAGVHLGHYGRDRNGDPGLPGLLRRVVDAFPDLRVRLSSIHPDELDDALLGLLAGHPQLRPHLHISLQSGSDAVLERMNRPYRSVHARDAVARAVDRVPDMGLGADLIVGFPGESEDEFAATVAMVEDLPFSYLHVFRYSPRPGTAAAAMPVVHPETVSERGRILRRLAGRKKEAFGRSLVGRSREAVVESVARDPSGRTAELRRGTTDNYAPVLLPGGHEPGTLVRFTATSWDEGTLRGEDVEPIAPAGPGAGREGGGGRPS
jgi:threonylcarbamoyladenosine tRNA methylthiotransferase MtaB